MRPSCRSLAQSGRAALVGAALTAAAAPTWAQPASEALLPAQELAESWLLRDCELGVNAVQESLRRQPDRLAELFLAAFRTGPSDDLLARTERASRVRFALRQRVLEEPARWGLSHIDLTRVTNVSEEEYVARDLATLRLRYRTQALRGLVVARPALARPLLQGEARDGRSPLAGIAARLLADYPPD